MEIIFESKPFVCKNLGSIVQQVNNIYKWFLNSDEQDKYMNSRLKSQIPQTNQPSYF